ncbi:hypothetical protein Mal35_33830 [Gimesia maris]|nr:hypothetical protein Mal35_33830 [Gimesia maris]
MRSEGDAVEKPGFLIQLILPAFPVLDRQASILAVFGNSFSLKSLELSVMLVS